MSKIQEYFTGKTVLVTGATGFLGKALVEKMLRGLPGLRRLYLLIRSRQGSSQTVPAADASTTSFSNRASSTGSNTLLAAVSTNTSIVRSASLLVN